MQCRLIDSLQSILDGKYMMVWGMALSVEMPVNCSVTCLQLHQHIINTNSSLPSMILGIPVQFLILQAGLHGL